MTERNWLWGGCSVCGAEAHMVNAKVVFSVEEPCEHCIEMAADHHDHLVASELGWCACGPTVSIDEAMLAYLTSGDDESRILRADGDAGVLLAYIADDLDWTDHGGVVTAAWLTPKGKEAIVNLRAALVATEGP